MRQVLTYPDNFGHKTKKKCQALDWWGWRAVLTFVGFYKKIRYKPDRVKVVPDIKAWVFVITGLTTSE